MKKNFFKWFSIAFVSLCVLTTVFFGIFHTRKYHNTAQPENKEVVSDITISSITPKEIEKEEIDDSYLEVSDKDTIEEVKEPEVSKEEDDTVGSEKTNITQRVSTNKKADNSDKNNQDNSPSDSEPSKSSDGNGNNGNPPSKTDCIVSFKSSEDLSKYGSLPDDRKLKTGAELCDLPSPIMRDCIFLGWYYDSALTKPVKSEDTVSDDLTLYASVSVPENDKLVETPAFYTDRVAVGSIDNYCFEIGNYDDECIDKFIDLADNSEVIRTMNNSGNNRKVFPKLKEGRNYSVTLSENNDAFFVVNGEALNKSIRTLTIITEKNEVMNLELGDLVYIPIDQVSEIEGLLFDGLFGIDLGSNSGIDSNKNAGTFVYEGDIDPGQTVAIYDGAAPNERNISTQGTADDKDIAYVTIVGKEGNKYSFKTADSKDVLFTPDVLPVSVNADLDGIPGNFSVTLPVETMDFSDPSYAVLGLNAETVVQKGDFIAFYSGDLNGGNSEGYAEITNVVVNDGQYVINYVDASEKSIESSMDIFTSKDLDVTFTEEELAKIAADIKTQAIESGFADEAKKYLVSLTYETDGFKELSGDLGINMQSCKIDLPAGGPINASNTVELTNTSNVINKISGPVNTSGKGNTVTFKNENISVNLTPLLQHFEKKTGLRIELVISFTMDVPDEKGENSLEVSFESSFVEEVLFQVSTSGGAVVEYLGFIPYIDDYELSAYLDMGNYTYVGVAATAKTKAKKAPEYDWKNESGLGAEQKIIDIGKQITELMEEKEKFLGEKLLDEDGEEIEPSEKSGGLAEKYADFIKDADKSWIKLIDKEMLNIEGTVDPLHILCYGIKLDFVVGANINLTIGATFETSEADRYSFTIRLFSCKAYSNHAKLEEENLNLDFYVFGTVGMKMGFEIEVGVGLFSLKLDSVGVTAETGVYANLWGYFYAHYNKEGKKKESGCCGALLFEVGGYLEVHFKAQLFSNDDLTYEPTIFEKEWPFFTLGNEKNIFDFSIEEDNEELKYNVICEKEITIPSNFFKMEYLDLKSGEKGSLTYDDKTESNFIIKFNNDKFTYDPETNTVHINVISGLNSVEKCKMEIIWKNDPVAFTSVPISRTVDITWTDPYNVKYISFNSVGGSRVKGITLPPDSTIEAPENPVKQGYVFAGWYSDTDYKQEFTIPQIMPSYEKGGVTVYAKWEPATDTPFIVKQFKQNLKGTYVEVSADKAYGTTDSRPDISNFINNYKGYSFANYSAPIIKPDGSTEVDLYYTIKKCTVVFTYGGLESEEYSPISYTALYGSTMYAPQLNVPGFVFKGYSGLNVDDNLCYTMTDDAKYAAIWDISSDIPYYVVHYLKDADSDTYSVFGSEDFKETTNATLEVSKFVKIEDGVEFEKATEAGSEINDFRVSATGDTLVKMFYTRTEYKLSFMDGEEVCEDIQPIDVAWGQSILAPNDPVKQGYEFAGWYKSLQCSDTEKFNFDVEKMPQNSLNIYAKWTPSADTPYIVEHYKQNADDDDYTLCDKEPLKGITDSEVEAVYKDYEHFSKNEEHKDSVKKAIVSADGSTVLKLFYDRDTVEVTFDPNGGELKDDAKKVFKYGQSFEVAAPEKDGDYAFDGWYLSDGSLYKETAVSMSKNFSLKAHWVADRVNYTVEHYVMGVDGQYQKHTTTPNGTAYETVVLDSLIEDSYLVPNAITYSKAMVGGEVKNETEIIKGMTVSLYYDRSKYSISWDFDGIYTPTNNDTYLKNGTYFYDTVIEAPVLSRDGYTYEWDSTVLEKIPSKNISYRANWAPNTYTVKFNSTGGSGTMDNLTLLYSDEENLPENQFTRTGYLFKGWTLTANSSTVDYNDKANISALTKEKDGIVTLYAVWENEKYAVTFNNITDAVVSQGELFDEYTYDEENDTTLPTLIKEGSRFLGWYEDNECSGTPITKIPALSTGSKSFYAKWEKIKYTITWVQGANAELLNTPSYTKEGFLGDPITQPDARYIDSDECGYLYSLSGWYTQQNGAGSKCPDTIGGYGENITYYAKWDAEPKKYNISFHANYPLKTDEQMYQQEADFTGKNKEPVDYGTAVVTPELTDDYTGWTNYGFDGWWDNCEFDSNSGNYVKTDDSTKWVAGTSLTGDVEYFAMWTVTNKEYSITWDLNSAGDTKGVINDAADSYTVLMGKDTIVKAPSDITRESDKYSHFKFAGWYDTPADGNKVTSFETKSSDVTYYAYWERSTRYYKVTVNKLDGSTPIEYTDVYAYDSWFEKPETPTPPEGAYFDGWYYDLGEGNKSKVIWNDQDKIQIKEDVTIFPLWRYSLCINGVEITRDIIDNIPVTSGKASLSIDTVNKVYNLRLENCAITSCGEFDAGIVCDFTQETDYSMCIELIGDSIISDDKGGPIDKAGISFKAGNLSIKGNGSLEINANSIGIYGSDGELTLESVKVTIYAGGIDKSTFTSTGNGVGIYLVKEVINRSSMFINGGELGIFASKNATCGKVNLGENVKFSFVGLSCVSIPGGTNSLAASLEGENKYLINAINNSGKRSVYDKVNINQRAISTIQGIKIQYLCCEGANIFPWDSKLEEIFPLPVE